MSNRNDFREIWLRLDRPAREALAKKLDTTYPYLQRISGGFKMPSLALATRMKKELPRLDLGGFERAAELAGKRMAPTYERAFHQKVKR